MNYGGNIQHLKRAFHLQHSLNVNKLVLYQILVGKMAMVLLKLEMNFTEY